MNAAVAQKKDTMKGKLCVVTGATTGIGKETARALACKGAQVVLVVRDEIKARAAVAEIEADSHRGAASYVLCDFASLASIREAAASLLQKHERIDVLVNNAGAINTERKLTKDGFELTFGVNHLGYFLFTNLLLDTLVKSAPARIVNVSSNAHKGVAVDFDDLNSERGYSGFRVYKISKLENVLFTYELARRLEGKNVTVNCLHPGVIASGFGHNNSKVFGVLMSIAGAFMINTVEGAKTSVYLASSPDVEGVTGKYFDACKEKRSSPQSQDAEAARRLWDVSAKLVGL
jgi:retinol dehydrogenase-12